MYTYSTHAINVFGEKKELKNTEFVTFARAKLLGNKTICSVTREKGIE